MVKTCLVNNCGNSERGDCRFHYIPKDPTRRQEWLDILNRNGGLRIKAKIGDYASLCHVHFDESCYGFGFTGKRKLLDEANPSLHLGVNGSKKARHSGLFVIPILILKLNKYNVHIISSSVVEPRDDDQNLLQTQTAAALSEDNSHVHNAFSNFDIGNPFENQDVNGIKIYIFCPYSSILIK